MTIEDVVAAVEKIPGLEARIAALEATLKATEKPRLAEWSTLREVCMYAGQSYATLRRPEYRDRRPQGGVLIRGVTKYPRESVEEWCREQGR